METKEKENIDQLFRHFINDFVSTDKQDRML
jgi:hypothetical protein